MKTTLQIVILSAALFAAALLADAWRSARRDPNRLNTTLATQNATIQQAEAHEKQRDEQLTAALAAIAAQKSAVQTPRQAAKAIPEVLPPFPFPIDIRVPDLSTMKPRETPPATITIPQADLKPLYDDLQDCRANAIEIDAVKKDLADEHARTAALTQERDSAIAAAKGGTFWMRLRRGAKWFAIGAAAGAAATAIARH
jgi:hypothetical protein